MLVKRFFPAVVKLIYVLFLQFTVRAYLDKNLIQRPNYLMKKYTADGFRILGLGITNTNKPLSHEYDRAYCRTTWRCQLRVSDNAVEKR